MLIWSQPLACFCRICDHTNGFRLFSGVDKPTSNGDKLIAQHWSGDVLIVFCKIALKNLRHEFEFFNLLTQIYKCVAPQLSQREREHVDQCVELRCTDWSWVRNLNKRFSFRNKNFTTKEKCPNCYIFLFFFYK